MKQLQDYKENTQGESFLLIEQANVKEDKRGRSFIALVLADKTGQIDAKIWNATEEDIAQFVRGKVVYIEGRKEMFQGRPQMRLLKMRLATQEEPNDPKIYQFNEEIEIDKLQQTITSYISQIKNSVWQSIVKSIVHKYEEQFYTYPAAKFHHHAFPSGLAIHTIGMLDLAQAMSKLYPQLNTELLYAGIILHDLGKVLELSGPEDTYYTLQGNLCGHIVLMDEEITLAAERLGFAQNDENVLFLKHVILAHHGKTEYGSPVVPRLLEAEVLNYIDQFDANLQMLTKALKQTQVGEYTLPIIGLDNRQFYKYR